MKNKFSKLQESLVHFGEDKKRQTLMLIGLAGVVLFAGVAIAKMKSSGNGNQKEFYSEGMTITDLSDSNKPEDEWMAKSEDKIKGLNDEIENLRRDRQDQDKEIKEVKEALAKIIESGDFLSKDTYEKVKNLESKIGEVKNSIPPENEAETEKEYKYDYNSNLEERDWNKDFVKRSDNAPQHAESRDNFSTQEALKTSTGIESFSFAYNNISKMEYTLDNYLPAGSYAKAKLLSSVDASVGIESQADPRPVLFRVTSEAHTAKFENQSQTIDIRGCSVTGAASGDLSSEKVYIRLLNMTCSRKDGSVIETAVSGYAAALGKAGIRGPVISREGDYLIKSFFAGMVGSFGSGIAQRFQPTTSFIDGLTSENQSSEDIIRQGVGEGTNDAADRLAEYLIERAEQYQPVISIPANIEVELVFIEGVALDGSTPLSEDEKEVAASQLSFNEVQND